MDHYLTVAIRTYNCEKLYGVPPYLQRFSLYLTSYQKNDAKTL